MAALSVVMRAGDGKVYEFPDADKAKQFEAEARAAGGDAQRLEPAAPRLAKGLYAVETHLAALLDTEELVSADQEAAYRADLEDALRESEDKRDSTARALGWLESQAKLARAEAKRLEERAVFYDGAFDRLKGYVLSVIEGLGLDDRGKRKRLVGKTSTMWAHGCDKRAEVFDAAAVPTEYQRATVTLPYGVWESMLDSLDLDLREQVVSAAKVSTEPNTSAIKTALKDGAAVPGARLAGGVYLVRE